MSQRLDTTKYLCYMLVLYAVPLWSPAQGVTVKTPPKVPSTIEAQAKFFQYRHFPTHEDFDQGHRLGSERHFTERHEKARPAEGLFSAKVRWGDKKGGYGEHYWDLNHAGHAGNHGDDHYNDNSDDGSYHHDDDSHNHGYDGSNDHSSPYTDDYDPEKSSYEESGRAKRAHPRIKAEKRHHKEAHDEDAAPVKPKSVRHKEQLQEAPSHNVDKYTDEDDDDDSEEEVTSKPKRYHRRPAQDQQDEPKEGKNQVVLVVKEKERKKQEQSPYQNKEQSPYQNKEQSPYQNKEQSPYQNNQDSQYVTYEDGAGVRQHQQPEVTAAASVPRLFLEPSTGHVVDRATGQAYVLQPIVVPTNYN